MQAHALLSVGTVSLAFPSSPRPMDKAGTRWSSWLLNKWITGLYLSGNPLLIYKHDARTFA